MPAPVFDQDLGFFERVEDFAIEQLVSEPTVKAFVIPVLPRASWFNESGIDIQSMEPVFEDLGGKFTAVVRPNISGHPLGEKQITEDIEHIVRFERTTDPD